MTKILIYKSTSLACAIIAAFSFNAAAFAHDTNKGYYTISDIKMQGRISETNARNLVKSLIEREFQGFGYMATNIKKFNNKWVVIIKDRNDFVATAYVDVTTGNIHFSNRRHKAQN